MRNLNKIIIHCADTPPTMDIGVKEIRVWHTKERGWQDIGYHYVIRKDGTIEHGRPIDVKGAHARNQNANSIGICYVGGADGIDDRTDEQKASIIYLIKGLNVVFGCLSVHGHNEFDDHKTCPNFNAKEEYDEI